MLLRGKRLMSHLREPDVRPELRPGGGTGAELADRVDAFLAALGSGAASLSGSCLFR